MSASKRPRMLVNQNLIRSELFDQENIDNIQKLWKTDVSAKFVDNSGTILPECNVKMIQTPFPVCLVYDMAPKNLITEALVEIQELEFLEKSNDLYEFHQTEDVANFTEQKAVKNLYSFICNDVFKWVEKTLVPDGLKNQVAATFSTYGFGDRLLCHDDKCEDRHIAFVLYLTEDWTQEDGGNLELFDSDDNGDPFRPVVTIPATFNTLVLFEVSAKSYHQVTEVLSKTKHRLSLNGWFHKENLPEWESGPVRPYETNPAVVAEVKLEEYMFDQYLGFKNQMDIKSTFLISSEIQLDDFLQAGLFSKLIEEFSSEQVTWKIAGPAHMRNYEVADTTTLPPGMSEIITLFQSYTWFRFLRNISSLDFTPYSQSNLTAWEKGTLPSCRIELQRWTPGCYTLIHDEDPQFHIYGLDAILRLPLREGEAVGTDSENPESGHVVYFDKETPDSQCLLHLGYKMNSLGLIYREPGVLRFTKYLNSEATSFYQIQCTYIPWMPPKDQPELNHMDSDSELNLSEDDIEESSSPESEEADEEDEVCETID